MPKNRQRTDNIPAESKALDWADEDEMLFRELFPAFLAAYQAGAKTAFDALIKDLGVGLDWALINQAAVDQARTYSYQLVTRINSTTRTYLQKEIPLWLQSGQPLQDLVDTLTASGFFGPVRAEMIAVTEVTRAFADGNILAWRESGVVEKLEWQTSEDELVCPICEPLAGKKADLDGDGFMTEEGGIGLQSPPAHIRCRCWLQPVVEKL